MKRYNKLRIISFILIIAIIWFFAATSNFVFAKAEDQVKNVEEASKETATTINDVFDNKTIAISKYIYNLDDSADYIYVEFIEGGYIIFSRQTAEIMEHAPRGKLYYSDTSERCYYAGPKNYFIKENSTFKNLHTNEQIVLSEEKILEFSQSARTAIVGKTDYRTNIDFSKNDIIKEVGNLIDIKSSTKKDIENRSAPSIDEDNLIIPNMNVANLIKNYNYFLINPTHGENNTNAIYGSGNTKTCGPVAAQLLLGYNNYYNHRRIIDNKYLNGYDDATNSVADPSKNPNYCNDPLLMTSDTIGTRSEPQGDNSFYCEMISRIMEPNTGGSTIIEVKNAIEDYLSERLIPSAYSVDYTFSNFGAISSSYIVDEIEANRPLIISMSENLGGSNHFVVGYGRGSYGYPDGGGGYSGNIVHYGWTDHNCVWINSAWCNGYISLQINHTHSYYTVGPIAGTNRVEYKCASCWHRTDAAINMIARERYVEREVSLPQNNESYKDYYVTFGAAGNKLIQTVGAKDTVIELYDANYNLLKNDNNSGQNANALICYSVQANTPYILRVKFNSPNNSGNIKFIITPASNVSNTYEGFWHIGGVNAVYDFVAVQNTTQVMTFTPSENGTYVFEMQSMASSVLDTYLYVFDAFSTLVYQDDNSGGNLQAKVSVSLARDKRYFIIASTKYIDEQTGQLRLNVYKST